MLTIESISKTFSPQTPQAKKALDNVSLHVDPGDFITLIGANGAGKSTLFQAIAGAFITDEGRLFLDGKDITLQSQVQRSRKIGYLFQDPLKGTAPRMTIEENLALAAQTRGWLQGISKKDRLFFKQQLAQLEMGLEDRLNHPVGLLSGGQRQALALLMATINPPKLLLLDEHTAALDPHAARQVLDLTRRIVAREHLTCLMVTHNMQTALELGTRTIMMHEGKILFDLSTQQRQTMTAEDLVDLFKEKTGKALMQDRMRFI